MLLSRHELSELVAKERSIPAGDHEARWQARHDRKVVLRALSEVSDACELHRLALENVEDPHVGPRLAAAARVLEEALAIVRKEQFKRAKPDT